MRNKLIILPLLFILLAIGGCLREHNVVDPVETVDYKQYGIYMNASFYHPHGVETLTINEGDTLPLELTSILINVPKYAWKSGNEDVIKIIPNPDAGSLATAIAVGDSGTQASITIYDAGNDVTKNIPGRVLKYWADPEIFDFMGKFESHYYYISKHLKTWIEGYEQCQKSGGYMLAINSEEENRFIRNSPTVSDEALWIGLTYLFDNPRLTHWVNGEPVDFSAWSGAGAGSGPGIAAEYYVLLNVEGEWQQQHEKSLRYVMEMDSY
jgi:hypothetical protein